ncbi:MAG: hypothetical protein ABEJ70_01300 [Halobacteriaceae archaeon]
MGIVRIRGDSGEETLRSRLWRGVVEIDVDRGRARVVSQPSDGDGTVEGRAPDAGPPPRALAWGLWLPTALALLTAGVAFGGPAAGVTVPGPVVAALAALTYVASTLGLVVLWADVAAVRRADGAWTPSAWRYLLPGTVAVAALLVVTGAVPRPATLDVGYVAGLLVVSAFLAPVLVGPVYRRRRAAALERSDD